MGKAGAPLPRAHARIRGSAPTRYQPAAIAMNSIEFILVGDYIEVNQLLKLTGACDSGAAGKALVAAGLVEVDGRPEARKTAKIRAGQSVRYRNLSILVLAGPAGP